MRRRLKVTITKIRTRTGSASGFEVFCPVCGGQTETLSIEESARLLAAGRERLEEMIAARLVHTVSIAGAPRRVCVNSLPGRKS
ncbi:MAG: hypothetical protein JSS81_26715 [Acidobacteria bacterium]|nr:hypothetical protein [Acidobacteriota bacterium]